MKKKKINRAYQWKKKLFTNINKFKQIKILFKHIKKKKKIKFFKAYFTHWLFTTKIKFYNIARFNENMFDLCFITILCFRNICALSLFGLIIKIVFKRQQFHLKNWHRLEKIFYILYRFLKKYKLNKLIGIKWQLKGRLKGKLRMNIWSKFLHTVSLVKFANNIDFNSTPIKTKAGLATLRIWLNKKAYVYTFLNLYNSKKKWIT